MARSRGAGPQASGPVQIFVTVPTQEVDPLRASTANGFVTRIAKVPKFLGWGELAPSPNIDPAYSGVKADPRGNVHDHDELYEGQIAQVLSVMLRIWDEDVLVRLLDFVGLTGQGTDGAYDTGTLMIAEGQTYELWLKYTRTTVSQYMINANAPQGYHYFAARTGQVKRVPGTQPNGTLISWKCLGYPFLVQQPATARGIGYTIYDNDMSGILNVPVTLNPPL